MGPAVARPATGHAAAGRRLVQRLESLHSKGDFREDRASHEVWGTVCIVWANRRAGGSVYQGRDKGLRRTTSEGSGKDMIRKAAWVVGALVLVGTGVGLVWSQEWGAGWGGSVEWGPQVYETRSGAVAEIGEGQFLEEWDPERLTINLSDETLFVRVATATLADLRVGAWACLRGEFDDEQNLIVYGVQTGDPVPLVGPRGANPWSAMGRISQIEGNRVTVNLSVRLPELAPGATVRIVASPDAAGPPLAGELEFREFPRGRPHFEDEPGFWHYEPAPEARARTVLTIGRIISADDGVLTVAATGTLVPNVRIAVLTEGAAGDVEVGGRFLALGQTKMGGSFAARAVLTGELGAL